MTEKQIETLIIDYINALPNGYAIKLNSGNILKTTYNQGYPVKRYNIKLAPEGSGDIAACINGRYIACEVKKSPKEIEIWYRQKDRRSQAQWFELERVSNAGGLAFIVSSLDEFIELYEKEVKNNSSS